MKNEAKKLIQEWREYEKELEQKSVGDDSRYYEGMLTGVQFAREDVMRRICGETSFSAIGPFCNICECDPCECLVEKTRKPLARGNVYQFFGYPTKIKIKYVSFRGHPEDDGGLPGVAVQWINRQRESMFYPCANDDEFWSMLIFKNAFDPINAEMNGQCEREGGLE